MKFRTAFISDIHLGTKISQTEKLLDFLKENKFDNIYLVGDVVDMSAVRRHSFYWDDTHNTVIQKILRLARKGVKITYIIGNHDIYLDFLDKEYFGNVKIKERDIYLGLNGEKCLVMHGHQLDGAIRKLVWLYWLGDAMYSWALIISFILNRFRRMAGFDDWSLSLYLKTKVKNVVKFVNNYERLVIESAKQSGSGINTVIVGHIHMTEDKNLHGIRYLNCGCWTEFCSAVVEHDKGGFELLKI